MSEEERKNKEIEDEEDDSEDDDYVPSDTEDKDQESADDEEELNLDEDCNVQQANCATSSSKQLDEAERKRRADELWADLCSSTSKPATKKSAVTSSNTASIGKSTSAASSTTISSSNTTSQAARPEKIKLTKEYDFAGEKIRVEEEVECSKATKSQPTKSADITSTTAPNPMKRGLGINSLVANLGKKPKLSTLSKTKLDWDMFKKEEGLEEDLKNHTKNKNSFIERQAFLQRTDLKQFELEKSVREKNRILKN